MPVRNTQPAPAIRAPISSISASTLAGVSRAPIPAYAELAEGHSATKARYAGPLPIIPDAHRIPTLSRTCQPSWRPWCRCWEMSVSGTHSSRASWDAREPGWRFRWSARCSPEMFPAGLDVSPYESIEGRASGPGEHNRRGRVFESARNGFNKGLSAMGRSVRCATPAIIDASALDIS
jgi:hypothetical protein